MKIDYPSFHSIFCSLRTTNIMFWWSDPVETRTLAPVAVPWPQSNRSKPPGDHFKEHHTRVGHERDAAVVSALCVIALLVEYSNDLVLPLLWDFSLRERRLVPLLAHFPLPSSLQHPPSWARSRVLSRRVSAGASLGCRNQPCRMNRS